MKKIFFAAVFLLLSNNSFGQERLNVNRSFTATGNSTSIPVTGLGISFYTIKWEIRNGTVSGCSFNADGSSNNTTFTATIVSATTCTSDGFVTRNATTANAWLRIELPTFTVSTGVPMITFNITGYNYNPLATAASGTYTTSYNSGLTQLTNSAGTVLTASTTQVQILYCSNITAGAVTVTIENAAGLDLVTAFSIAANSNVTFVNNQTGIVMVGVNWWASANTSINCYLGGNQ